MLNHSKKAFILFTLFLSIHFSVSAQKGSNYLSLGPSVGIPLNFNESYKAGIGAGIRGYFGIGKQGFILGNLNFLSFPYKIKPRNLTLTSAKFGIGSFLNSPNVFIYGDGGLVIRGKDIRSVDPGLGAGIGFALRVPNGGFIDFIPSFNVAFQEDFDRTWMDLHIAYRFRTRGR